MQPRPADFSLHVTHHTEGEFFWFISRGVPNTAMLAFVELLTEEERWLLARYIRELGEVAPSR